MSWPIHSPLAGLTDLLLFRSQAQFREETDRGSGLQPCPLVGWRGEGLVLGTEAPSVGISMGRHREEAGSAYLEWRGW